MRLLPQRHDHEHQGAAAAYPSPLGDRAARSAALQFVPMRRTYRDHARGNAGGGCSRRGARLMAPGPADNRELRPGSLSVVRPAASGGKGAFETFVKITADGSVTAFNGHVDLGTGIRTALGQIVAEELDVSLRASSSCWAIPRAFPIRVLPSPAKP